MRGTALANKRGGIAPGSGAQDEDEILASPWQKRFFNFKLYLELQKTDKIRKLS